MTEAALEKKFSDWLRKMDVIPIKGPALTVKGFPDRFFQLPNGGGTVYVEFKGTSYYSLTPLQAWWKEYLTKSSPNRYFLVENEKQLLALIKHCEKLIAIGPQLVVEEGRLLDEISI